MLRQRVKVNKTLLVIFPDIASLSPLIREEAPGDNQGRRGGAGR